MSFLPIKIFSYGVIRRRFSEDIIRATALAVRAERFRVTFIEGCDHRLIRKAGRFEIDVVHTRRSFVRFG